MPVRRDGPAAAATQTTRGRCSVGPRTLGCVRSLPAGVGLPTSKLSLRPCRTIPGPGPGGTRMLRHAASPASLRAVRTGLRDADVRALLPRVACPGKTLLRWRPRSSISRRTRRHCRRAARIVLACRHAAHLARPEDGKTPRRGMRTARASVGKCRCRWPIRCKSARGSIPSPWLCKSRLRGCMLGLACGVGPRRRIRFAVPVPTPKPDRCAAGSAPAAAAIRRRRVRPARRGRKRR